MTNTTMLNDSHDPQEIIKSVKKGLYAANFGGGQVGITSGKEGQSVPVGVGQPTVRIDWLTVGGTG